MKLTGTEEERQYLLLVTAAAVRARLQNADQIGYTIDRLQRVVARADESGHNDIATIARGELDVARRLNEENSVQQVGWTRGSRIKPRVLGDYIVVGDDPEADLELTFPEANSLQADLRELLAAAGVCIRTPF